MNKPFTSKHCAPINYGSPLNQGVSAETAKQMAEVTKKEMDKFPDPDPNDLRLKKMISRANEIFAPIGGYKGMKITIDRIAKGIATPQEIKALDEARKNK